MNENSVLTIWDILHIVEQYSKEKRIVEAEDTLHNVEFKDLSDGSKPTTDSVLKFKRCE